MAGSAAELFDRFHLAIYRYLLRMTGRREVAEDLTQEVFVRILRSGDLLDRKDSERAWLFAVARNLLIDWRRRAARNPVGPASEDERVPEDGIGAEPRYDVALDVGQALQQLENADREAFVLRVVGGFGHEEIASLTGTTAASVRSRIFRARSMLRAALTRTAGSGDDGQGDSAREPTVRRLRVVR